MQAARRLERIMYGPMETSSTQFPCIPTHYIWKGILSPRFKTLLDVKFWVLDQRSLSCEEFPMTDIG